MVGVSILYSRMATISLEIRKIRTDSGCRSRCKSRCTWPSSEYIISDTLHTGEDLMWREIVLNSLEPHEFDYLRCDEEGNDDDDESDDRISNTVDCGLHLLILPPWEDEHHTSPDDEENRTEYRNEDDDRDSRRDHLPCGIVVANISETRCMDCRNTEFENWHKKNYKLVKSVPTVPVVGSVMTSVFVVDHPKKWSDTSRIVEKILFGLSASGKSRPIIRAITGATKIINNKTTIPKIAWRI